MRVEKQHTILRSYHQQFDDRLAGSVPAGEGLTALSFTTFQINVGKRCNQACTHCHVDASPTRTEMMSRGTAEQCIRILEQLPQVTTVDITGGAPEMNRQFRYLVTESKRLGKHVIDRCNLTILELQEYDYLYQFLSEHEVEIIASLPHYAQSNTDKQRGDGVYELSMTALKKLNAIGYGTHLPLHLVYNPVGLFLCAPQQELEREFKSQLLRRHGIVFHNLYCINNLPISRFLAFLHREGKYEQYMDTLSSAFNPATIDGLMCRHQISIGYDGQIFDCDFNQMLGMTSESVAHIDSFDAGAFMKRTIKTGNHCFGCTAGAGSSCGGSIVVTDSPGSSDKSR